MRIQHSNTVLMVRPANFGYNQETAANNAFQNKPVSFSEEKILEEFDAMVSVLRNHKIEVIVVQDTAKPIKPDAVFPNNWFSTHANGSILLYPMYAQNRRLERRIDIIEQLKNDFEIQEVKDFSAYENHNKFMEGTGSIVFDHQAKMAYLCISERSDKQVFEEVCNYLAYKPFSFTATDKNNKLVYHTNVLMCVTDKLVIVCLEAIKDISERENLLEIIYKSNKIVVEISLDQMNAFAGNMLAVSNKEDSFLAMSASAYAVLTETQKQILSQYHRLLPIHIPTIETIGGGSVRCMLAEIYLPSKSKIQ
jgi:hypothetical protein